MIDKYAKKLIENMPDDIKNTSPLRLDIVLDGGAFNGSYLIGALYFLKEMEKRNYVKVERISGCSIGAIAGFLYLTDNLDLFTDLYDIITKEVKKTHKFIIINDLKTLLNFKLTSDICGKINNKLYITYHNIEKGTKPVKRMYVDYDDIINTILKSCYIPFILDGNLMLNDKYIDGVYPYVFKKRSDRNILYMSITKYDQLEGIFNIKNEKTNYNRILTGLLDIHNFYIKKSNTTICSYVNDWSTPTTKCFNFKKMIIESIIVYIVRFSSFIKKYITHYVENYLIYKIISIILYDIYIISIDSYCF